MNIIKFISCINSNSKGSGGHYYSLVNIAKTLIANGNNVIIIVLGNEYPLAYRKLDFKLKDRIFYININIFNIFFSFKKIIRIVNKFSPEVLHSYDRLSHFWVSILSFKLKLPCVTTKCGGENSKYFPFCRNIIVFSNENLVYLKTKSDFRNSIFYHIPNRVFVIDNDYKRLKILVDRYNLSAKSINILRVCRISNYYKNSIFQSIELFDYLTYSRSNFTLTVIGIVEDVDFYNELRLKFGHKVNFVTENELTYNASQLICFFDIVVGTGRSLMEALSKNKIILSPVKNSNLPVLIYENTFKKALDVNFSERLEITQMEVLDSLAYLKEILYDSVSLNNYKLGCNKLFKGYFDINMVSIKYIKLYSNLIYERQRNLFFLDILIHYIFVFKNYVK